MTIVIREKTLTCTVAIVLFIIFGVIGTLLLFNYHTFVGLFLYLFGGMITFILFNIEYEWVKIK